MRYLLLVHVQEPLGGNMAEEEGAAMRKAGVALAEEMGARGARPA